MLNLHPSSGIVYRVTHKAPFAGDCYKLVALSIDGSSVAVCSTLDGAIGYGDLDVGDFQFANVCHQMGRHACLSINT